MSDEVKKQFYKQWWFWVLFVFILFVCAQLPEEDIGQGARSEGETAPAVEEATPAEESPQPEIGVVIKARYFEITVEEVSRTSKINTGNEFTDLTAPEGSQYLLLTVNVKNVDTESRMFLEGSLFAEHGGRELEYDVTETLLTDTGFLLEQLNPLTSKRGHIAYQIANELKGDFYWRPGRSRRKIFLGSP